MAGRHASVYMPCWALLITGRGAHDDFIHVNIGGLLDRVGDGSADGVGSERDFADSRLIACAGARIGDRVGEFRLHDTPAR